MSAKNKILFLIVLLQTAFFISWFFHEASKLKDPQAKTILVKTIPVDPRDLISGNYFTLNYEFSNSWNFNKQWLGNDKIGTEVYAVLKQQDQWFVPDYLSFSKPKLREGQAAIKGKVAQYSRIEYGVEKFFISENQKAPNSRTDKVEVMLAIDENLNAKIKNLLVNGKEF
jgi:uncharacterized membrane-anchored protein